MNSQMPEEMALGFTSDIAKNNLGESFYRTVTRHSENARLATARFDRFAQLQSFFAPAFWQAVGAFHHYHLPLHLC